MPKIRFVHSNEHAHGNVGLWAYDAFPNRQALPHIDLLNFYASYLHRVQWRITRAYWRYRTAPPIPIDSTLQPYAADHSGALVCIYFGLFCPFLPAPAKRRRYVSH